MLKFPLAILCVFLFTLSVSSFKVGFFSENLGGKTLESTDFSSISKAIALGGSASSLKNSDLATITDNKIINAFDVIQISLQEAKAGQYASLNTAGLESLFGLSNDFKCTSQVKIGVTKVTEGKFEIVSIVCYKTAKFTPTIEKNPDKIASGFFSSITKTFIKLKGGVGQCLKLQANLKSKEYCFIAAHMDTNQEDGADRALSLYDKLAKRAKNKDLNIYLLGDWNNRLKINQVLDENNVKSCLNANLKGEKTCGDQNQVDLAQADTDSIKLTAAKYSKDQSETKLLFLGSNNLHSLPFTYKYLEDSFNDPAAIDDFNIKGIIETKTAGKNVKSHNFGWLDRIARISLDDQDREIIRYSAVPGLRKADHMPIAGAMEVTV